MSYGTLTVAKSDGVRSGIVQKFLTNPKKFSSEFETIKSNLRRNGTAPVNNINPNLVNQLEKLIEMKRSGDISEEEFIRMKQSLMGS